MKCDTNIDERGGGVTMAIKISQMEMMDNILPKIVENIHRVVAEEIAELCVKEYLPEIMKRISPEAIANMSIAEAGAEVNATLHKKLPDKILHVNTTKNTDRIFKRTIFGNLKRID